MSEGDGEGDGKSEEKVWARRAAVGGWGEPWREKKQLGAQH